MQTIVDMKQTNTLLIDEITKRLGNGYSVKIKKVLKTNMKVDGLIIMPYGGNITPTIYLEPYYRELEKGVPMSIVVSEIIDFYMTHAKNNVDMSNIMNFEKVKPWLYVKLINKHMNEELLENIPHRDFLDDLAIVPNILVDKSDKGVASITIWNNHINLWNVDPDYVIDLAIANTRKLFNFKLKDINKVIGDYCVGNDIDISNEDYCEPESMFVLTNDCMIDGASMVLYDDILKDFADKYGSFYIIFSSIHEALLVPMMQPKYSDKPLYGNIDDMNRDINEINETQVNKNEVLGTKGYIYLAKQGRIIVGQSTQVYMD
jgi:hypothetical protein